MGEALVSFKTAELAKEKKFEWLVRNSYSINPTYNHHLIDEDYMENWNTLNAVSAPTQSLLQRWLREVHSININIRHIPHNQKYSYNITGSYHKGEKGILISYDFKSFESYEDSLEESLFESLSLIETPIGTCNRTNGLVYPTTVDGYAGYSIELDEDVYEFEFTRFNIK